MCLSTITYFYDVHQQNYINLECSIGKFTIKSNWKYAKAKEDSYDRRYFCSKKKIDPDLAAKI